MTARRTPWLFVCLALSACASAAPMVVSDESPPADGPAETTTSASRDEAAAPVTGASCGDRTCGVDELCVPQGFCSGVRLPTSEEERAVTYQCVAISHECAEAPTCGCAGDVCRYGGCASIRAGVVQCICA